MLYQVQLKRSASSHIALLVTVTFLNWQTMPVMPRWHQPVYRFQAIQVAWTREHYRFHLRHSCELKSLLRWLRFQKNALINQDYIGSNMPSRLWWQPNRVLWSSV